MTLYEEISALRQELKRPSVFRHNHIQKYKVDLQHKCFYIRGPDASICIYADIDALFVKCINETDQFFCLDSRFASGEGYSTFLAEECLLVYSHVDNVLRFGWRAPVK